MYLMRFIDVRESDNERIINKFIELFLIIDIIIDFILNIIIYIISNCVQIRANYAHEQESYWAHQEKRCNHVHIHGHTRTMTDRHDHVLIVES